MRQVKADPASGQAPTFAEMDKDHSGDISFQEMREALLQATPSMPEDDIRRCFAQLDFNQDGKVSRAEFFGHRAEEFSGQQRGEEVAMRVVECLYRCCLHVDLDEDGDEVAHDCVCPSHAVCGRPCQKCEMVRAAHLRALERAQVKKPVPEVPEVRTCALKQYHQSTHRVHSSCLPSATHFFCACDCLGSHPSLPQAPHALAAGSLGVEVAEGTQLAAGLTHITSSAPSATTPLSTGLFPATRSAEEVADCTANQEHDHTWEEHQQERRLQASAELDLAAQFWHAVEQGGRRVLPRGVGAGGARIGESTGQLRHVIRVYGSAPRPVVDATLQGSAPRPRPPQDHMRDELRGGRAKALSSRRTSAAAPHRPATKELQVRVTEVSHVGQPLSDRGVSHSWRPRSSRFV